MARVVPEIVSRALRRAKSVVPGRDSDKTLFRRQGKPGKRQREQRGREIRARDLVQHVREPVSIDKMANDIAAVEAIIDYRFKNHNLCLEALTLKGDPPRRSVGASGHMSIEGNKRLALVGDVWLKVFCISRWYHTGQTCGEVSRMMSVLESNKNLEKVGYFYGIDKHIHGRIVQKSVADTIEALIGAVAEDGGQHALHGVLKVLGLVPQMDGAGNLSTILHI